MPLESVIAPVVGLIVDVPPEIVLMALRTSCTVPTVTSIDSVPAVAEPVVPEPELNAIVVALTTIVSVASPGRIRG